MMSRKMRILIIEDDPDDSALLLRMLVTAKLDRHVSLITDGAEAWNFLSDPTNAIESLVAIFLDLNLPSMGGLDLIGNMLGNPRTANVPVIVMTSSNSPSDLEECQRLGVSGYVRKPITREKFIEIVAESYFDPGQASRISDLPADYEI
jgi:two-component system response regulator